MSDFINLVLSAYDPSSPTNQEAQNRLIVLKNSDCNAFINMICESIQFLNLDEKTINLLLILSREAFTSGSELKPTNGIPSEILSKYESILITGMNDQRPSIRLHSSMSFGNFGCYCILQDPSYLNHFFQLFNTNNLTYNLVISFEKSLLYILKQIEFPSAEKTKQISQFLFSRLTINDESLIEEKSLCLQMLLQITPLFLNIYTQDENIQIFQLLKNFSLNPKLTYYSFSIWSKIMDKSPLSLTSELFSNLIEISIHILANIESSPSPNASYDTNSFSKNDLIKLEIFKFLSFSLYSNCPLTALISPYLPKLVELSLRDLHVPGMSADSFNLIHDCSTALLSSVTFFFPKESLHLFLPFIEANKEGGAKSQYGAFVLFLLVMTTDSAELFLSTAIQMIRIAFNSPAPQVKVAGLSIVARVADFADVEPISSQIDLTSFLPLCLNFFTTGIEYFQSESAEAITKIVSAICEIEFDRPNIDSNLNKYRNFNVSSLIREILNIIQCNRSLAQVKACVSLADELVTYVTENEDLLFIFQFTCQLIKSLSEQSPNDSSVSACCALLSTVLGILNRRQFAFQIDLLSPLFQTLLKLKDTENGGDSLFTIGFIAFSLKGAFRPMLAPTLLACLQSIDAGLFVRQALLCVHRVMASCESSSAIGDVLQRVLAILGDDSSTGSDILISFTIFRGFVRYYYGFLSENSNFLRCMIGAMNSFVEGFGKMISDDRKTALSVGYIVFELFVVLLQSDARATYALISGHFFVLASSLIAANTQGAAASGDDEDDEDDEGAAEGFARFVSLLVTAVKALADAFGPSLRPLLEKSRVLPFLVGVAGGCDESGDGRTKAAIENIVSIVCSERQQR